MLSFDAAITRAFVPDDEASRETARSLEELRSLLDRRGSGAEMLGWLDLPRMRAGELGSITDAAKRVQDECDCLVVVGIGGSYLGARAAIEALPAEARFPVLFAGTNLSPPCIRSLLDQLEDKRFALCVISKSGTTLEPAIAFRVLRGALLDSAGEVCARKRIIAVTDPREGALRRLAGREGWLTFPIPPDVGGRFSVLSAVGLLPCAAAGVPVKEMMEGASAALARYSRCEESNDAIRYAAVRSVLQGRGAAIEVLSTFHPELRQLCEWWKQLAGESEGKRGKGLFPASTVCTTDLHSLGQYLQEGPRSLLETFLVAAAARADIEVPVSDVDDDGLGYLAGRSLFAVNRTAFEGTREAHAAGGIPVLTIELPEISAAEIGALFVFFEIAVSVSGRLLGVNPFDQPGVEEYKKRMFRLLGKPGAK